MEFNDRIVFDLSSKMNHNLLFLKEEVFMPNFKQLDNVINGFEVIQEDDKVNENGIRYAIFLCKVCQQEFRSSIYHINKIKSCGCLPCRPPKELPDEINGFKILKDYGYNKGTRRALVICKVCTREYEVDPNKLKYRHHCGCIKRGSIVSRYNKEYPRLGNTYKHMLSRCYKKNSKDYYLYGERGIRICDEWLNDRNTFIEWSLNNGYGEDLTIDRIDSNGNYCPENCRWVDAKIQARNTSRNVLTPEMAENIRSEKDKLTVVQLSLKYNVSLGTIRNVINNKSWTD